MRRWRSCLGSWLLPRFFHPQCLANSLSLPFSRYVHIFIQNHWRINCRRSAPLLLNISTFENRNILLVDHGTIIRFSRFSPETIPLSTVRSLKSAVVLLSCHAFLSQLLLAFGCVSFSTPYTAQGFMTWPAVFFPLIETCFPPFSTVNAPTMEEPRGASHR